MKPAPKTRAAARAALARPAEATTLPPLRGNNVALAGLTAWFLAPGLARALDLDGQVGAIEGALARARRERDVARAACVRLGDAVGEVEEAARAISRKAP
jgi:hypothetical protein